LAQWRKKSTPRRTACFVRRPATRLRHIRKEDGFICLRIKAMTADSFKPNCASIASKAVRSSHAISTMRETLAEHSADIPLAWWFFELTTASDLKEMSVTLQGGGYSNNKKHKKWYYMRNSPTVHHTNVDGTKSVI
jgi:hypothetical protein